MGETLRFAGKQDEVVSQGNCGLGKAFAAISLRLLAKTNAHLAAQRSAVGDPSI